MASVSERHVFVALADSHLRSGDSWNGDRLAAWDQVIEEGQALDRLAAWLHAGDVFDAKSTIQDRMDVADRFQRMAAAAPVLVVQGNHEAPGDLAIFRRLKAKHPIVVVESAEVVELPLATSGTASIFTVPYPQKSVLVSMGVPPDQVAAAADKALDVLFMDAADKLLKARGRGHVTFMVGHANIAGARSSTGQPMIGQEISLSASHLARLGPVCKLMGHIHLPQELHGASYVGSGSRLSWGETEEKRFLIATFQDDSTYTLASRQLACPPRYHVEGDLSRDGFGWQVRKGPDGPQDEPPASWDGADVRVRARYPAAERDVLATAKARIAALFPGVRRLDVEPIAVTTRELRAPEVVQAKTLDEKLTAWAKLSGVSWSSEISRCAEQLLASEDVDVVVADVGARLGPLAELAPSLSIAAEEEVRV